MGTLSHRRVYAGAIVTVMSGAVLVTTLSVRAQRGGGGGAPGAKPLVPMTASSLLLSPDTYVGDNISLTAAVEQTLTKTVFSVDQDRTKSTGKDVLVIAPNLTAALEANSYITVTGEVIKFSPEEVAKKLKGYTLDLAPDVIEKYRGKIAVLATAVITPGFVDLAKRVAAPMTPAELTLQSAMKSVSAASPALTAAVNGSNADQTKEQSAILKRAFGSAAAFFQTKNAADAVGWAQDGVKFTDTIDAAVAAGKWDDAKTAASGIGRLCASCHSVHRDTFDDGSFRFKG